MLLAHSLAPSFPPIISPFPSAWPRPLGVHAHTNLHCLGAWQAQGPPPIQLWGHTPPVALHLAKGPMAFELIFSGKELLAWISRHFSPPLGFGFLLKVTGCFVPPAPFLSRLSACTPTCPLRTPNPQAPFFTCQSSISTYIHNPVESRLQDDAGGKRIQDSRQTDLQATYFLLRNSLVGNHAC